jgi:hypothetical protein
MINDKEQKDLNRMNRAAQNVQLGDIIHDLQSTSASSVIWNRVNVSASSLSYTVQTTDVVVRCNANSGSLVINLLPATSSGRIHSIKNLYTSACIVRVVADTTGTPDLIDGEATQDVPLKGNMMIQDGDTNRWDIL